jgi:hypothetical protein
VTRRLASIALLLPSLALAQASAIGELRPTLPPTNAALADEVTAPEVNPAGLQFIGGPMLIYQHERNLDLDSIVDGLYFGSTFFDWVGFGVGLNWVRGPYAGGRSQRLPEDLVHLLRRRAVAQRGNELQRLHPEARDDTRAEHLGPRTRQPSGPLPRPGPGAQGHRRRDRRANLGGGVRGPALGRTAHARGQLAVPRLQSPRREPGGRPGPGRGGPRSGGRDVGHQELARARRPVVLAAVGHPELGARGWDVRARRRAERPRPPRPGPVLDGPLPGPGAVRSAGGAHRPGHGASRGGVGARPVRHPARRTLT